MLLKKQNPYLGLANIPILIIDQSSHSDYFNISNLQPTLTSGKNMFKLYGNHALLQKGSEIMVEVIDDNGEQIFHTVNDYVDPLDRRMVTVWIFPDTPPGPAHVNIVGTAKRRPNGRQIPLSWEGKPNVRWRRKIEIDPLAINTTPITFLNAPFVSIAESKRNQISQSYASGSSLLLQDESIGNLTYNMNTVDATLTFDTFQVTSNMLGGQVKLTPPISLVDSWTTPASPPDYYANIISIENASQVRCTPKYSFAATFADQSRNTGQGGGGTISTTVYPETFATSNTTMSYFQTASAYTTTSVEESFANIVLANIDPMAGDVDTIRAYMRQTSEIDWQFADEVDVEGKELFVDPDNIFNRLPCGKFTSLDIFTNYWESGSVGITPDPQITINDADLMDSIQISGSEDFVGYPDAYFKINSTKTFSVYAGNKYYLAFRTKSTGSVDTSAGMSIPVMKAYMSGSGMQEIEAGLGKLIVTCTATDYTPQTYAPIHFVNGFPVSPMTRDGGRSNQIPLPNSPANPVQPNYATTSTYMGFEFTADADGTVVPVFKIESGKWWIADISVQAMSETGFTPNHTFMDAKLTTAYSDVRLDFKFEFYNPIGLKADYIHYEYDLDFALLNSQIITSLSMIGDMILGDGIILQGTA